MPAHSEQPHADTSNAVWYLGLDFGTTGISAVLLNYSTGQRYPIYWSNNLGITDEELRVVPSQFTTRSSGEKLFRLPAVIYSGSAASREGEAIHRVSSVEQGEAPIVIGSLASTLANKQPGLFLQNFKPYLNLGIPYYCPKHHGWEPTLQLSSQQLVSLYWVRRALQALLATLSPQTASLDSMITVGAVDLESETLESALRHLEGVILGYPATWGDTYHFNLREAVLEAKLVRYPEQIFFLEDAIASILAGLPSSNANAPKSGSIPEGQQERNFSPILEQTNQPLTPSPLSHWRGGTLVINVGANTTELALVDLPDDLEDLTNRDFNLYSLPYAGNAIDLDIFCQLLYPQMSLAQQQKLSLDTHNLELPLPGQPDPQKRDRLTSLLQSSPLGRALLKATGYLKLILQHKDEFTLKLGTDQWVVLHSDLEARVILPFIQQLNQKLNTLLIETGISEQGIYQVLCIGGTGVFATLQKWIQQKLPLATLIQDSDSPTGNWVAAGLATLPLYPQVLNRSQQQYSDYFLLLELLRAFPKDADDPANPPYSLEEIMQHLERRGLNTSTCYERLVRLLEGQLPSGLVPSIEDDSWLSQASKQNLHYSMLTATPQLFSKEGNQLYRPNCRQHERLRQYLDILLSRTHQKFEEPLIVKLGTTEILHHSH